MKINWREEFIKLFPESIERELKENHKWCDKCKGIGFIKKGNYISFCNECSGKGQIELCTMGCGREKHKYYSVCSKCKDAASEKQRIEHEKRIKENAHNIKYSDYEGKFLIFERVMDKEALEEEIYYRLLDGEEVENYIFGTTKEPVITIDMHEIIKNKCESGYEEMYSHLDFEGIKEIQKLTDNWINEQGEANYCYWEDNKTIVLLDEIIADIKKQIKEEKCR